MYTQLTEDGRKVPFICANVWQRAELRGPVVLHGKVDHGDHDDSDEDGALDAMVLQGSDHSKAKRCNDRLEMHHRRNQGTRDAVLSSASV